VNKADHISTSFQSHVDWYALSIYEPINVYITDINRHVIIFKSTYVYKGLLFTGYNCLSVKHNDNRRDLAFLAYIIII
jgi:hypothetical protein